ncbi:MAG: phosphatidylserine decarboxylase [Acidobacteriaceae bacterium]
MVRDGYYYGISLLAVAVLVHLFTAGWIFGWVLTLVPVLLAGFFLWFFRDPNRVIPQGAGLVVSPADGKVTEIARIQTADGPKLRLSIFLSVFNVHVNRAPIAGVIREVVYKKGEYLNALNPDSAERNEQSLVVMDGDGCVLSFKLIAGLLARRIVFQPQAGATLARGERVGLIKFGSRVDVLLPGDAHIRVEKGQRVQGGSSVLADIEVSPADTEEPMMLREVLETRR